MIFLLFFLRRSHVIYKCYFQYKFDTFAVNLNLYSLIKLSGKWEIKKEYTHTICMKYIRFVGQKKKQKKSKRNATELLPE